MNPLMLKPIIWSNSGFSQSLVGVREEEGLMLML